MGASLPKQEGEDVSLGSEQCFTDKLSSEVNETPLGKDLLSKYDTFKKDFMEIANIVFFMKDREDLLNHFYDHGIQVF